jgi:hypothetical protein
MAAITREALLERKAALEQDLNAIGGALQDVAYWLAVIDQADTEAGTTPASEPLVAPEEPC